jgi:hypothetical protein
MYVFIVKVNYQRWKETEQYVGNAVTNLPKHMMKISIESGAVTPRKII